VRQIGELMPAKCVRCDNRKTDDDDLYCKLCKYEYQSARFYIPNHTGSDADLWAKWKELQRDAGFNK